MSLGQCLKLIEHFVGTRSWNILKSLGQFLERTLDCTIFAKLLKRVRQFLGQFKIWLCEACCQNRVVVTMMWQSCLGALALESLQACCGNLAVETLLWKPCCGNHALTAMLWYPRCEPCATETLLLRSPCDGSSLYRFCIGNSVVESFMRKRWGNTKEAPRAQPGDHWRGSAQGDTQEEPRAHPGNIQGAPRERPGNTEWHLGAQRSLRQKPTGNIWVVLLWLRTLDVWLRFSGAPSWNVVHAHISWRAQANDARRKANTNPFKDPPKALQCTHCFGNHTSAHRLMYKICSPSACVFWLARQMKMAESSKDNNIENIRSTYCNRPRVIAPGLHWKWLPQASLDIQQEFAIRW